MVPQRLVCFGTARLTPGKQSRQRLWLRGEAMWCLLTIALLPEAA